MTLTPAELALIDQTAALTNDFHALPEMHPGDQAEFVLAMHQIQRLIMVRSTRREHPDVFGHGRPAHP